MYGHYYSDLYLTLLYWSTGRGMPFYAILLFMHIINLIFKFQLCLDISNVICI